MTSSIEKRIGIQKRGAERARLAAMRAANAAIVATGKCPQCSSPLLPNITLSGWFQCAGFGAIGFRGAFTGSGKRDASFDLLPACNFQVFA